MRSWETRIIGQKLMCKYSSAFKKQACLKVLNVLLFVSNANYVTTILCV